MYVKKVEWSPALFVVLVPFVLIPQLCLPTAVESQPHFPHNPNISGNDVFFLEVKIILDA